MIGLDTSTLIRLLAADDPAQAAVRKTYGVERAVLQNLLEQLLGTRTFCFEDRAAALYASSTADFSDCLNHFAPSNSS